MDYCNDQSFQAYIGGMIASSPAESSASQYDGVPAAEVSYDGVLAAEASGDYYFYDEVGHGVSYEEDIPSDEVFPVANAGGAGKKKKEKKRKRDPNKPKGWISAVLMYSNAHRARVKLENPDATFGDIARLLSAEYKTHSPEDTAFWEEACADDRARYERAMLSYVPPFQISEGDDSESCVEETVIDEPQAKEPMTSEPEETMEPQAKKPKKKKDPNAPKKNLSAWHFFSGSDARKQVPIDYPGASRKDIMGILSRTYRLLSEEERAPFSQAAAADKKRYQREMELYKGTEYQYY